MLKNSPFFSINVNYQEIQFRYAMPSQRFNCYIAKIDYKMIDFNKTFHFYVRPKMDL